MRDSTSQPRGLYTLTALNTVNGDERSGAEKQELLTKEGKDVMMITVVVMMIKSVPLRLIGAPAAS